MNINIYSKASSVASSRYFHFSFKFTYNLQYLVSIVTLINLPIGTSNKDLLYKNFGHLVHNSDINFEKIVYSSIKSIIKMNYELNELL